MIDRIDRHVARRFVTSFVEVLLGVCLLYAIIDFSDRSGDYTGPGWVSWVLQLYANRLAKVAVLVSPAAMLVAAGLTVSSLRSRSELAAILSAGRSPFRLAVPIFACALAAGGIVYAFDDAVAVHAALRAERITAEHFHVWGSWRTYFERQTWLRLGGTVLHVGDPTPDHGFRDATVLEMSSDFSLRRRVDARRMSPAGGDLWLLSGARVRTFDGDRESFARMDTLRLSLPGADAIHDILPGRPEMLSRAELRSQIRLRRRLGLSTDEDWFEYFGRVAYVLVGAAGTLLAAALALRGGRRGHVATSLLEGLVVAGSLWGSLGVARALSISGKFSPATSAFAPEVLALALGTALVVQAGRKTNW